MLSSIPQEIIDICTERLGQPQSFLAASGGCINNGGLLTTKNDRVFIKWNSATRFPKMFDAEARGLELMHNTNSIYIPKVIDVYEGEGYAAIVLEYVESAPRASNFWKNFGESLAEMHQHTRDQYGLDHDNYMGSLPQVNEARKSWIDFFVDCRLTPQIDMAKKANKIDGQGLYKFEQLIKKLPDILVEESPALVHGDLWSGNFITGPDGLAALIDPAIAFSHREIDLAMTRLFGGFDREFYQAYHDHSPLASGFEERFDIYNLYPLMVHVNLFGGSYYQQVLAILNRYT